MDFKVALVGNPNSGKTTLFNLLTGSNQYVGNWPGVTVEKKEGKIKGNSDVVVVDLPGIYSLSPYTLEEVVARNFLIDEKPDVIINLVDGSNLERNLYLTTQLIELGIPVIAAVNMMDVVRKNKDDLNTDVLGKRLGISVVEISALRSEGIDELIQKVVNDLDCKPVVIKYQRYNNDIEQAISSVNNLIADKVNNSRWHVLKILERDKAVIEKLALSKLQESQINIVIKQLEKKYDDDSESIIINERYNVITELLNGCYKRNTNSFNNITDKIDSIVMNKWLALPIFAAVMFLVYYVSVTTVGAFVTGWTNDVLFGNWIIPFIGNLLKSTAVAGWLQDLVVNGIVGGVGAVLGFVPQLFVLFMFLAILEFSGYMSRIAFILDRIFRRFGLSGKSFIPMLIGSGCSVPGIMASRTIENENDRRMTIITTSFIPCSAKLPIISLIAGALFNGTWWVAPSAYFIGIAAVVISGVILKKTKLFSGGVSPFVMELPPYHLPSINNILRSVWERSWGFIKKAGTVILLSSVVIWLLVNFGFEDGTFKMVTQIENSVLASFGSALSKAFIPLGWGDWKPVVATITGLIAKENVVSTFGVLYGVAETSEDGVQIWSALSSNFSVLSAYSFLVFNLLCAPCFAAVGAIRREMNNAKWTAFAVSYQCGFAYVLSLCIYQLGMLIQNGVFTLSTLAAFSLVIFLLYMLFRPVKKSKQKLCTGIN